MEVKDTVRQHGELAASTLLCARMYAAMHKSYCWSVDGHPALLAIGSSTDAGLPIVHTVSAVVVRRCN